MDEQDGQITHYVTIVSIAATMTRLGFFTDLCGKIGIRHRQLVRWLQGEGLTERRSLAVARMSASSLRYQPRPDRNAALRTRIVALAQRHRSYGVGMVHLKLRQAEEVVNYKRVERLYRLEQLHIRRRRRKKVPVSDRQPLIRPGRPTRSDR